MFDPAHRAKPMATYDIFAPFYDAVQGDRAEEIT
jgi:hypothetical protein